MEARSRTLLAHVACLLLGSAAALLLALTVGAGAAPGAERSVTLVGAGDIADCDYSGDTATARLVDNISGTVFTLGDNVQEVGVRSEFKNCYEPTWGKFKRRTMPAAGNHEYYTEGAKPYYDYFGNRAGNPNRGYYSYDKGAWHIVVLNSNCEKIGGCDLNSPQAQWLRDDLAANRANCTLAYWHHPRYASGDEVQTDSVEPFWQILYNRGAELVLNGHAHRYERHLPLRPNGDKEGALDRAQGIQQFIVGTGGKPSEGIGTTDRYSKVKNANTFGVLRLSLKSDSYGWKFVPVKGKTFTDSGTRECH